MCVVVCFVLVIGLVQCYERKETINVESVEGMGVYAFPAVYESLYYKITCSPPCYVLFEKVGVVDDDGDAAIDLLKGNQYYAVTEASGYIIDKQLVAKGLKMVIVSTTTVNLKFWYDIEEWTSDGLAQKQLDEVDSTQMVITLVVLGFFVVMLLCSPWFADQC